MKLKFSANGIADHLKKMSDRSRLTAGWLNRVAYPYVLRAQRMRWQTEGESEGKKWAPIKSVSYRNYKLKKYRDYPGAGTKLLIATNRLVDSMTGDKKKEHYKMVDPAKNRLYFGTRVPYAEYLEEGGRDLTSLGPKTMQLLGKSFLKYIYSGEMKGI